MAKEDLLSQLTGQQSALRKGLAESEDRLTTLEVTISDERVRGARLRRLFVEKDRLKEQIADCRGQIELLDIEIRHREQAAVRAGTARGFVCVEPIADMGDGSGPLPLPRVSDLNNGRPW